MHPRAFFISCDLNGDGHVSASELQQVSDRGSDCRMSCKALAAPTFDSPIFSPCLLPICSSTLPQQGLHELDIWMDSKEIDALIAHLDSDRTDESPYWWTAMFISAR